MATLVIQKNPFDLLDREVFPLAGQTAIDVLQANHPDGFGAGCRFFVNGTEHDLDYLDMQPNEGDLFLVLVVPKGGAILSAIIGALISSAISLVINLLFAEKPETPEFADVADPTDVYSVTSQQNQARIGQSIPVVYGDVRFTPDLAAQPYRYFEANDTTASPPTDVTATWTMQSNIDYIVNMGVITDSVRGYAFTHGKPINGWAVFTWYAVDYDRVTSRYTIGRTVRSATVMYVSGVPSSSPVYGRGGTLRYSRKGIIPGRLHALGVNIYDLHKGAQIVDITLRNQFLDQILCLGEGDVEVDEVYLGDTPLDNLLPGTAEYVVLKPGEHNGAFGAFTNKFTINDRQFYENIITSSAVAGIRFAEPLTAGWFVMSETDKQGQFVEFDIEFPAGIYSMDAATGALQNSSMTFEMSIQEVDIDNNPVGAVIARRETFTYATNEAIRISLTVDGGRLANWQVSLRRINGKAGNTRVQNDFTWSGVKMYRKHTNDSNLYANCTVMGVRIRATETISQAASSRISVRARRVLPPQPGLSPALPSYLSNPAHIAADVYTNETYGARRPQAELDLPAFNDAATAWETNPGFNGVFTGRSTVFEAMKAVLTPVLGRPLPLGGQMTVIRDGVKPIRTQMFTMDNIVQGSFNLTYNFDPANSEDGVEVEYRDPITFDPSYVRYPEDAIFPELVQLFGSTDRQQAADYGRIFTNRKSYQKVMCSFQTELEGHIPLLGDRIGVQHELPTWGLGGRVVAVAGLTLTLDGEPDFTGGTPQMMLRRADGSAYGPVPVAAGAAANEVVLAAPPDFTINEFENQEPTYWAFGTLDMMFRDFIVTSIEHQGELVVKIIGLNYDERVYDVTGP